MNLQYLYRLGRKTVLLLFLTAIFTAVFAQKPRLLVTTDIGGDPDDRQSLIRLMLYTSDFEVEGLISSAAGTPGELGENIIRPDLIEEIIHAYGRIHQNLLKHNQDFPSPDYLLSVVKKGNPLRGWEYTGEGHDTEASEWIIRCADRDDQRPLNIAIWGGQTDVARALRKVKETRTDEQYRQFVSGIRIYDIADQDGIFSELWNHFPELFYILNKAPEGQDRRNAAFRGMYLGGDENLTSMDWIREHILDGHGPLGALYPVKTWTAPNPHGVMKEGDTPSWFYFLLNGLNSADNPEYGGWGGRFYKTGAGYYTDTADTFDGETNARATVFRWRDDFQRDFAARMDWCVMDVKGANHHPVAVVNGHQSNDALVMQVKSGRKIRLNASRSYDPDGGNLDFEWVNYPEANIYSDKPEIEGKGAKASFVVPSSAVGKNHHVILKLTDKGTPQLSVYKRIIIIVRD